MRIASSIINFYLPVAILWASAGCQSTPESAKELSTLRLHLETSIVSPGKSVSIPIYRANPVMINVVIDSFLDEAHVEAATVKEDIRGGFNIWIKFDHIGTSLLNATTLANPGRRIAVESQFPEPRWLAAPIIQRRISDGVFVFTPDATREEAERIVHGINNGLALAKKRSLVY